MIADRVSQRVLQPAGSGLPRWWIVLWFPALLALVFIVLVALGISGSSTGSYWQLFDSGPDPNLLAGIPRPVRSDEWLTQHSWIVSQAEAGFQANNPVFPGGMDATVLLGLPAWDFFTIFRPDAIGFMVLGLDHGLAVRWWLPGLSMTAACYAMLVALMPRRPLTSATVAVAFFFSPLIQWWYLPSITWPAAMCFLAIAATVFSLRDPRWWVRIVWAALTGYVAVCAVLMLYPPVLIAAALVAAAMCLGFLLTETGTGALGLRVAMIRVAPLLVGGLLAGLLVVIFFSTKSATVALINDTVYPGHRLAETGQAGFKGLVQLFGAPFAGGLDGPGEYLGLLGVNASEASTPVLIGLFLIVPLAWFVVHDWRSARRIQWPMLAWSACSILFILYLLVPGWDVIAHLLLLDRTTANRSRMAFALLAVVGIALLVRRLDERDRKLPWWVSVLSTAAAIGSIAIVWVALAQREDQALTGVTHLRPVAVIMVLGVLLYTRGHALTASICLLAVSLLVGAGVNPLYRGIFDLRQTDVGQEVVRLNEERPGNWLGIGSYQLGAVLFETGVPSFNGVQLYPSPQMWEEIDPQHRYPDVWNRYASLAWSPGPGEPVLHNPQDDVISMTFDSCSNFAAQHVTYVVADRAIEQPCLTEIDQASEGPSQFWFYRVTS